MKVRKSSRKTQEYWIDWNFKMSCKRKRHKTTGIFSIKSLLESSNKLTQRNIKRKKLRLLKHSKGHKFLSLKLWKEMQIKKEDAKKIKKERKFMQIKLCQKMSKRSSSWINCKINMQKSENRNLMQKSCKKLQLPSSLLLVF